MADQPTFQDRCEERLDRILGIVRRIASEPRLDPLLEAIAEETCRLLDAERTTLFLYDHENDELYSRVASESEIEEIRIPANRGIVGSVAQAGGELCLNIPDAYADPRFNSEVDRKTGWRTRNILAVPMTNLEGELVGVMEAMNQRDGAFTGDHCRLLTALAAQAGVALERARLLEEFLAKRELESEMALARDIQIGLLPLAPPQVEGYEMAGVSHPSHYAGGDFYDLFPWGEGRVGVMLGDAVGHGVGPALLAATTRALVRALAQREERPGVVLADANRLIADDVTHGRFVTLALARVEVGSNRIAYASAGQGPLLVIGSDGRSQSINSTTVPLGVLPEVPTGEDETVGLEPGGALVMISDGVFECAGPDGVQLGTEPVVETIRRHKDQPAEAWTRAVIDLTRRTRTKGPFQDDRTVVVVRRRP